MAIYHFSGQVLSRSKGQSVTAAAAYRSGESLYSERYHKTNNYQRLIEPTTYLLTPPSAPTWANDREKLWNEVEKIEQQKNAQLAREFNVALPVELSEEEQNTLAKTFCQDQFVSKGMVADLSIHRDDRNNPHFHVLLTMRGFTEDGRWGSKAKKINGKRVNTTDWGDRETFREWRKQWATYANHSLAQNHVDERISHLSHADTRTSQIPTIHEGYAAREMGERSERVQENKTIKKTNHTIVQMEHFKEEKEQIQKQPNVIRHLSPNEKKKMASLARELKTHVNFDTLNDKKRILKNWYRSEFVKKSVEDQNEKKLAYIRGLNDKVEHVEGILSKEADRFMEKQYPSLATASFSSFTKRGFVDQCVSSGHLPMEEEAILSLRDLQERETTYLLSSLTIDSKSTINQLQKKLETITDMFDAMMIDYRIDFDVPDTFERLDKETQVAIQQTHEKRRNIEKGMDLLTNHYHHRMASYYGEDINNLTSLEEKELILAINEYTGSALTLDSNNVHSPYSVEDKKHIIDVATATLNGEYVDTNEGTASSTQHLSKLRYVLQHNARFEQLFLADCLEDEALDEKYKTQVKDIIEAYQEKQTSNDRYKNTLEPRKLFLLSHVFQAAFQSTKHALEQLDYDEKDKVYAMRQAEGNRNEDKGMSL